MKVKDVMTHSLVSITPRAPIQDAIARMINHQVSGMPVVDENGRLVGIVSEGDFLRRAELHTEPPRRHWLELLLGPTSLADDYVRSNGRTVEDVMTREVVTAGRETALSEIVHLMEDHGVKRIPIVEDGRLIGIVTRADVMSALGDYLMKSRQTVPADDDSIRRAIQSAMSKASWCFPVQSIAITVRRGIVELKGTIFDERERRALRVLVENVAGVKGTRDHLALFEPAAEAPAPPQ